MNDRRYIWKGINIMGIGTKCVQDGYRPGNGEPRQIPIIQSTTFKYNTSQDMGKLFDLEASGYFYTRLQNPTNDYVAAKIASLEGGNGCDADVIRPGGQFLRCVQYRIMWRSCRCIISDLWRHIQSVRGDDEEDGRRVHIRFTSCDEGRAGCRVQT